MRHQGKPAFQVPKIPMGEIRAGGGSGHRSMSQKTTVGSSSMSKAKPIGHKTGRGCSSCGS